MKAVDTSNEGIHGFLLRLRLFLAGYAVSITVEVSVPYPGCPGIDWRRTCCTHCCTVRVVDRSRRLLLSGLLLAACSKLPFGLPLGRRPPARRPFLRQP